VAQPERCVERPSALAIAIEKADVEHAPEMVTQVMRGASLQRPELATHHRFDRVRAQRPGEFF
jgi:hypothetical protein